MPNIVLINSPNTNTAPKFEKIAIINIRAIAIKETCAFPEFERDALLLDILGIILGGGIIGLIIMALGLYWILLHNNLIG